MASERPTSPLHRLPRQRRQWVTIGLAAVIVVLLLWIVWDNNRSDRQAEVATEQAKLSAANAEAIARQIHDACKRQDETAERLGDVCQQAELIAEEPTEPAVVAPTDEQLRPLVQEFTESWLARHPPRDGRDGETPTADQIADLISAEYARNPPQDGEDGEDGRTPTAAEVRPLVVEAVNAYLAASPPPPGEPGTDGRDGADGQPGRDGIDGRDGVDGAPGEPPDSWTTTRCDVIGRCITETCVRAEPFDPQAPAYTCSESAAPEP